MKDNGPVVLGLGDASDLVLALPWALAEARGRGLPVHIVSAYEWALLASWERTYDVEVPEVVALGRAARQLVDEALGRARELAPDLAVTGEAVHGPLVDILLAATEVASVTVLGARGTGPLGTLVPGSAGPVTAARASGPVVVVRGAGNPDGAVVVGVDGRSGSEEVLACAFDRASRFGRTLHAVLCWRPDLLATMRWRPTPPAPDRAARWLAEALAGWQEKFPDVTVQSGVVRDHPVAGLVAASMAADVLVVGSAGTPAAIGRLLGSVSQGVLHHATCPVVVVPVSEG